MARLAVILGITAALAIVPAPLQAGPRADALLSLERGIVLLTNGHNEQALEQFDEAIGLDPTLARAHQSRGIALTRLGRHAEAIDALETASELAPDNAGAHLDLALAYALINLVGILAVLEFFQDRSRRNQGADSD